MNYTIKKLATLAGVSVRTLHFYDEIGLLTPSFVHENGYRYYGEKELRKLQQILFFRELAFPLEQIKEMMNSSHYDEKKALEDQKALLLLKQRKIERLLETIDKTLKGGEKMNNDDLFGSFSDDDINRVKAEVKNRWGNTEAYRQSMERTRHWTKEDYKKKVEEGKEFLQLLGKSMDHDYKSDEVQVLIQKQHEQINFYYDCSLEMYKNLADMYISDPRFTKTYEDVRIGLAQFVHDAIYYYCEKK